MSTSAVVPVVRRRPKNRRAQIVAAAARLFWERGYRQVSMVDVAAEVEIGASALYRHFQGKVDLLIAVLTEGLERLERAADGSPDLAGLLEALVVATLEQREQAALWVREAAELSPDAVAELVARRTRVLHRLETLQPEPDGPGDARSVTARAALAVVESLSVHRAKMQPDEAVEVLGGAAMACLGARLGRAPVVSRRRRHVLLPHARAEALMASASRLFAERGYHAVSLGEIGAAVGIAGPSIYNHFPSKADLLVAILRRGTEVLWSDVHRALAEAEHAAEALGLLVDSYSEVVRGDSGVVAVLLAEFLALPDEEDRERYRGVQRRYVSEWVVLLRQARPELSETSARALVLAALTLIRTLALPPGSGALVSQSIDAPVPALWVRTLARAVLGLPAAPESSADTYVNPS